MIQKIIIIIGVATVLMLVFFISKSSANKIPKIQIARQIKLDGLETMIEHLVNKNFEYDFFGITSNGIDCIYFINNNGKINIEFEVMVNEQKPFVDKLKEFAKSHAYHVIATTYGNTPKYDDVREAPVYKLEINADIKSASDIGKQIMIDIFNCDMSTNFDVVP